MTPKDFLSKCEREEDSNRAMSSDECGHCGGLGE